MCALAPRETAVRPMKMDFYDDSNSNVPMFTPLQLPRRPQAVTRRLLLNGAIQAILEDGTYASINARYFDFDLYGIR